MRREDIIGLVPEGSKCLELGVAQGEFAELVLSKYNVVLYGIDRWSDHHNDREYHNTLARLAKFGASSIIIRTTFEKAVQKFPDGFFDLIYVDGYAHTGQNEGKTLYDWYPKVKDGGVFSGDDYSNKYPKTVKAVDEFCKSVDRVPKFTDEIGTSIWSQHPSWYIFK